MNLHSTQPTEQWMTPAKLRSRTAGPTWLTMLGVWVLVFVVVWSFLRPEAGSPLHDPAFEARAVTPRSGLTAEEQATIDVFRGASPSVVYITSTEYGRDIRGLNIFEIPLGTGSGFVYDDAGHIVTNYHVIAGADAATVTLADQSQWDAELVGREPDKDLVVLKIAAPKDRLKPIALGRSDDLVVGQKVLAIGNPFGLDQTLTVGVVSALGREIQSLTGRKIRDVIQTDAAINPGNSGGPLLDSAGRLIGVNTQIASPSGASAGIGFAVPVDIVNEVVPDLIRYGHLRRATLGITPWNDRLAQRAGLPGALVMSVQEGSGAAEAGLRGTTVDRRGYVRRLGDVIMEINGTKVRTLNQIKDALEPFKPGDEVEVTILRDERPRTVKVRLQYND